MIAETRDHPLHIVYVHGMRAEGPGASQAFRAGLCRHVAGACDGGARPPVERSVRFDLGAFPDLEFLGGALWRNEAEWQGSWPFVDRYVYRRAEGASSIIVDEVNWWPILFAVKCRALLQPDAALSGADRADLTLCARDDPPYYPFIDQATLRELLATPPRSGGGARVNVAIKQQLVNWGLGDVAISIGPIRRYLHRAMETAFAHAADYEGRGATDQAFVVVAESLGAFVVLDAFASLDGETPRLREVVTNTADLYLFANQFALLELTRLHPAAHAADGPPHGLLRQWALAPTTRSSLIPPRPRQIVAFNDPSDALTFNVPALTEPDGARAAIVANLYVRNEFDFFGLFADPVAAHTGYSKNDAVLRTMFAA